jgi:hypothetical protein
MFYATIIHEDFPRFVYWLCFLWVAKLGKAGLSSKILADFLVRFFVDLMRY